MAVLRYLSHPQVVVDPAVPVPDWGLSKTGRTRVLALDGVAWLRATTRIVSSTERKAQDTALLVAAMLKLPVLRDPMLNEIDRSATGYVPHDRHEALADAFFADPSASIDGWECADSVRRRGMTAIHRLVASQRQGDLLIVGHGGIGTLCWCALAGIDARSRPDQPPGGGAVWAVLLPDLEPLHGWTPMEQVARLAAH